MSATETLEAAGQYKMQKPVSMNQPGGVPVGNTVGLAAGARGVRRPRPAGPAPRRSRWSRGLVHVLLALAAVAAPVEAQVRIGGHGVYRGELLASGFGVGARAEFDLGFIMPQLGIGGVYNRFSSECDECGSWEGGGQVTLGDGVSYIGLNVLLARTEQPEEDDEIEVIDDWKFSVVIGLRVLNLPVVVPFLEVRQSMGSGVWNDQALSLGVLVGPARPRRAPRPPRPR